MDVLAAQSWAEADEALAEALIAQFRLAAAVAALRRKLQRRKDASLTATSESLDAEALGVEQALRRAAKARGLVLFGAAGAAEPYDPKRHRLLRGEAPKGAMVKIVSPGVALGRTVIAPAEARPLRTKTTPAPPKKAPSPPVKEQAAAQKTSKQAPPKKQGPKKQAAKKPAPRKPPP